MCVDFVDRICGHLGMSAKRSLMLLKATILLGTLKPKSRKEFSNTAVLCELLCDEFAKHEVKTEIIRLVEYKILPGTKSNMGKKDEWPRILEKLVRADIIVFATPIWLSLIHISEPTRLGM